MADSSEVLHGTLDLLILSALRAGALHGWGVAQFIRSRSDESVLVTTGALYPALHRLESRRLLKGRWRVSGSNRRARFYELTPAGRKALGVELEWWNRFVAGVSRIIAPA
ncbi:MAG: PadR family transcriptional regulator [Gemmatimonadota bacterium]